MQNNSPCSASRSIDRARAAYLLEHYIDISDDNKDQLVHFLKRGPSIDVALIRSDPLLGPAIEQLRQDRQRDFDTRRRDAIVIALLLGVFAAFVIYLWDFGGR